MLITKKSLKVSDPTKLCLVIPLENGIKVQYPVVNTEEAIARYTEFLRTNAMPQTLEPKQENVEFDTFSRLNKDG